MADQYPQNVPVSTTAIPFRNFIRVLNEPHPRRTFMVVATEDIVEYTIVNNTVLVKILDRLKVGKLKQNKLLPTNKQANIDKKFLLGRTNSVRLAVVIALINANPTLKAKMGLAQKYKIINLLMNGRTLIVNAIDETLLDSSTPAEDGP